MSDPFGRALIEKLPNLRRFALSLCRSGDTADDLVQITVERALSARASYDPATRIEAWLFRILRNAWIDMARKHKIRGTHVRLEEAPETAAAGHHPGDARLMVAAVMDAVERLPIDQREVLLLVCVEDLSYAEAATILNIPKGTVMSRLSRARTALAGRIGIK